MESGEFLVLCPDLWKTRDVKRSKVPNPGILQGMDAAPKDPGAQGTGPPTPTGVGISFPPRGMCWRSRNSWEWCLLGTLCQLTVCCLLPVQSGGPFRIAPQHSCFTPCPVCPSDCCPRQPGSPPRPVRGGRCYWSPKLRSPWSVPFILTTRLPPEEVALSRFHARKLKPGEACPRSRLGSSETGLPSRFPRTVYSSTLVPD